VTGMNTISALIRRRPVLTYFTLVILISWTGGAVVVGPGNFPLDWERFEQLGGAFYGVSIAGPVVAGLLLTGLLDGRRGLRELRVRLGKWRVGASWYGLALLPAVVMAATLLALSPGSWDSIPSIFTSGEKVRAAWMGAAVGLVFGLEELGWTGFAVPRLRVRHGILATSMMVGLVWGAWHFPLFWQSDSFSSIVPLSLLLVRLFSWLPAFRTLLVWIYDRTGSLLLPMLMHGCVSAVSVVLVSTGLSGGDLWAVTLAWPLMMWLLVGALATTSHGHLERIKVRGVPA